MRQKNGQARLSLFNRGGQATIEFSLVVGILFLFLCGVIRIAGWFNSDMTQRQQAFKGSRIGAASPGAQAGEPIDYQTKELSIF